MTGLGSVLNEASLGLLAFAVFVSLLVARELGGILRIGLGRGNASEASDEGFILSAALGLLALLIAFTFGLALNRYETRRELVVAEANAIGTAFMRVQVLDPTERERMSRLLTRYAQTRLAYGLAQYREKPGLLAASITGRGGIETAMIDIVRPIRLTPLGPSLLAAVNDVSDRGSDRDAAQAARLPTPVVAVLLIFTAVSAAIIGYVTAAARTPHRLVTSVLFVLLTMAIWIVLDLDRPRDGMILVSQAPMAEQVNAMAGRAAP
jgi:hypothetical protein